MVSNMLGHRGIILLVLLLATSLQRTTSLDEYTADGWFYRNYMSLTQVPDDIPEEAVGIYLNNNNIVNLTAGDFAGLASVTFMSLSWNLISNVEPGSFQGLDSIKELTLFQNRFVELKSGMFLGLDSLDNLVLSNNQIDTIHPGAFRGLHNLKKLFLYGNRLSTLKSNVFFGLDSLDELTLTFNSISVVEPGAFMGLSKLEKLWLDNNNVLTDLTKDMFLGLDSMFRLSIHTNNISSVAGGVFTGLLNLEELDIDDNYITDIGPDTFHGLNKLSSVWLYNNRLTTLPASTFSNLPRPVDLTIGGNPLQCDNRLCWIKKGEREGWLRWIQFQDRPLEPQCTNGINWHSLQLDCPEEVECGDPGGIHHGVRGESHWPYTINSTISFSCQPCYTGGGTITCQTGGKWSQKPECNVIFCPEPEDVKFGVKVPDSGYHSCGSHVTYICNHGYQLQGDATRYCLPSGKFNGTKPACVSIGNVNPQPATGRDQESDSSLPEWWVFLIAAVAFILIIIIIVAIILVARRRRRSIQRQGSNMEAYNDMGAAAVGGSYEGEGGGYVNKAAMLHDTGVSFQHLQGKDGAGPEDDDVFRTSNLYMSPPGGRSSGASGMDGYEVPVPPPEYTRHPSEGEISDRG